jgi:chemotaxis protein CheD
MVHATVIQPLAIIVGVADLKASNKSNGVLTTYALGSCLGISCYDPVNKVGGLLHAMLPDSKKASQGKPVLPMFLDTGLQELLHCIRRLGSDPDHCEFKVFGGARVLHAENYFNIGTRNIAMMQQLAGLYRLNVRVWEVGGQTNRTIRLYLDDGRVQLHMPSQPDVFV